VWHFLPWLFQAIQFPWRFNVVLCLAALPIGALFLSGISQLSVTRRILALGVVCLIILAWLTSYDKVWKRYKTEVAVPRAFVSPGLVVNDDDGWFDAWSVPGLDQTSALSASVGPRIRFLGAVGTVDVRRWEARHIEFQANSQTGGRVMINQFYYPAWTAASRGETQPLEIKAAMPEGLLELEVPPGRQEISVEIPISFVERRGAWVSALCLLLCVVLVLRQRQKAGPVESSLPFLKSETVPVL
jgi:uncharacterized membrane protein YfhO